MKRKPVTVFDRTVKYLRGIGLNTENIKVRRLKAFDYIIIRGDEVIGEYNQSANRFIIYERDIPSLNSV